jgi:hypothetical protein
MLEIPKNPWEEHDIGFKVSEELREETFLYRVWFEYLRLSPTFWLAHKAKNGVLTQEERLKLPEDFDVVMETYKYFYDIYRYPFWGWWFEDGRDLFGKTGLSSKTGSKVTKIAKIPSGRAYQSGGHDFREYLRNREPAAMKREESIFSVPLDLPQKKVIKQFTQLIAAEYSRHNEIAVSKSVSERPIYKFYPQKYRLDSLEKGLRVMWVMAEDPNLILWKVGHKARISYIHKNPDENSDSYHETVTTLKNLTSRYERKAINVMENAARGRFPCYESIATPSIDYKAMGERLRDRHAIDKIQNENFRNTPIDDITSPMYQIIHRKLLIEDPSED